MIPLDKNESLLWVDELPRRRSLQRERTWNTLARNASTTCSKWYTSHLLFHCNWQLVNRTLWTSSCRDIHEIWNRGSIIYPLGFPHLCQNQRQEPTKVCVSMSIIGLLMSIIISMIIIIHQNLTFSIVVLKKQSRRPEDRFLHSIIFVPLLYTCDAGLASHL